MRFLNTLQSAVSEAKSIPFAGLGFATETVQAAAQAMTLTSHNHAGSESVILSVPDFVEQPSGYSLLVTLSREIRGR